MKRAKNFIQKLWEQEAPEGSVLAMAKKYLNFMVLKGYTLRTQEAMRYRTGCFLLFCQEQGMLKVQEITPSFVERYHRHLMGKEARRTGKSLDRQTVGKYLSAVCQLFRYLERQEIVSPDPTREVQLPKPQKKLPKTFSHAQVETILNGVDLDGPMGIRDRAILELLYSSGLRREELTHLALQDVDISARTVSIRDGKGGKDRLLPLGERAARWLEKYIAQERPGQKAKKGGSSQALFLNAVGTALRSCTLGNVVNRYIAKAGLTGSCHQLRHAMATAMLENGADIRYIQEMLGHKELRSTELYTKVTLHHLQEVYRRTHPSNWLSTLPPEESPSVAGLPSPAHSPKRRHSGIFSAIWQKEAPPGSLLRLGHEFVRSLSLKPYQSQSIVKHREHLAYFFHWCMEREIDSISRLTRSVLGRYQTYLANRSRFDCDQILSVRYRKENLCKLHNFLRYLYQKGHLLDNLAVTIQYPKQKDRLPRFILTVEEIRHVLDRCDVRTPKGLRERAILELLYATGIRRSELVHLQLPDIDFSLCTLHIRLGKGGRDRLVPISLSALQWAQRYIEQARPFFLAQSDSQALFMEQGQAISPHFANQIVTKAIGRANLGKTGSCHLLRHSMATHMLDHGADIRYIQAILGHSSLTSTQIYTHVSIRKLQDVHAKTHPAKLSHPPARDSSV